MVLGASLALLLCGGLAACKPRYGEEEASGIETAAGFPQRGKRMAPALLPDDGHQTPAEGGNLPREEVGKSWEWAAGAASRPNSTEPCGCCDFAGWVLSHLRLGLCTVGRWEHTQGCRHSGSGERALPRHIALQAQAFGRPLTSERRP